MKCIILLTLVALCYSYPYGYGSGRNINVNPDGSITVTSVDGRRFTYSRGTGPSSTGYFTGYQSYGYQPYQSDALIQLLQKYQGNISQYAYQQLLEELRDAVQTGQVRGDVYETLQGLNQIGQGQIGRGSYGPSQLWQLLQYGQQGRYQQYPGAYVYSPQYGSYLRGYGYQGGRSSYSPLFANLFKGYDYGQYGQIQPVTGQLSQVIQGERQILGQQDKIQQEQIEQYLQQQQLYQQQWQQQKEQQYLKELQKEVLQEQEQVLGEQQRLQQYQEPGYGGVRNWLSGGKSNFLQEYYGVYPLGRSYGGYGKIWQRPSIAGVY